MNVPWIEIIKTDLYTVDRKPVYKTRGTLSGTTYNAYDKEHNEVKIDATLEEIRKEGFENPKEVQHSC